MLLIVVSISSRTYSRTVASPVDRDGVAKVGRRVAQHLPGVCDDQFTQLTSLAESDGPHTVLHALCLQVDEMLGSDFRCLQSFEVHHFSG